MPCSSWRGPGAGQEAVAQVAPRKSPADTRERQQEQRTRTGNDSKTHGRCALGGGCAEATKPQMGPWLTAPSQVTAQGREITSQKTNPEAHTAESAECGYGAGRAWGQSQRSPIRPRTDTADGGGHEEGVHMCQSVPGKGMSQNHHGIIERFVLSETLKIT